MNMLKMLIASKMFCSGSGGSGGGSGGGGASVAEKDVNFYDYDGTCLYAYTVDEAQALTELPPLPEQPGLICQGWNWTLDDIKAHNRAVSVGAMYITDDGKTRLYITLPEGRTSPLLGVCLNGTVTVDWGDGTEPDVLTGTSMSSAKWTPNHEYTKPGDYVITLAVDGEMGFAGNSAGSYVLRFSSGTDNRSHAYLFSLKKAEIGNGVTQFRDTAFNTCRALRSITIPNSVTSIGGNAFQSCNTLRSITIPNSVTSISGVVNACYALRSITIPNGVTSISGSVFTNCYALRSITIPNGVTSISGDAFYGDSGLTNITIPNSVTSIGGNAFRNCYSMCYYDFSRHTSVPTLLDTAAFSGIPADCEIRVHAALYDEWIAATNWSTLADRIVAV